MGTNDIEAINAAFAAGSSFLIATHENPDGDAIGSCLALANHLQRHGKRVVLYCADPVPEVYRFLPGAAGFRTDLPDEPCDYGVILDVGERQRAGAAGAANTLIRSYLYIDHHADCVAFGEHNLIDAQACATAALLYRLFVAANQAITLEMALCLYTAIVTDTGSFRHANANPEAFVIAGELVKCGVNAADVARKLFDDQPRERLELLAQVLPTLEFVHEGAIAALTVTRAMYAASGAGPEWTDGFIGFPRSVKGVEVAILFRELEDNLWKVGLRSRGQVDVAQVAASFGGGGHRAAAGCTLNGSLAEVRQRLLVQLTPLVSR